MKKPKKNNFFKIGKKVLLNEIKALTEVSDKISKFEFNKLCNLLANTKGNLIFLGIGKSGKVSEKISATLSSLGRPSFYISAAEASHGDLGAITNKDIVVILSFSGETEEIIDLFPILETKKIKICSITGNKNSTIAKTSLAHLSLNLEKEADEMNLVPTSSTTAMMMLGDAISISLSKYDGFKKNDFGI